MKKKKGSNASTVSQELEEALVESSVQEHSLLVWFVISVNKDEALKSKPCIGLRTKIGKSRYGLSDKNHLLHSFRSWDFASKS